MEAYIPVVLVLLGAPLVTWLTIRASRPKIQAESTEILNRVSTKLVLRLETRLEKMEKHQAEQDSEIAALKRENVTLHRWAQVLFTQVVEAGGEPVIFETIRKLDGEGA